MIEVHSKNFGASASRDESTRLIVDFATTAIKNPSGFALRPQRRANRPADPFNTVDALG
jgi:hypothetical protein